ncbi:hypothetical protein Dimus_016603, partial [Dionaea muscipula]
MEDFLPGRWRDSRQRELDNLEMELFAVLLPSTKKNMELDNLEMEASLFCYLQQRKRWSSTISEAAHNFRSSTIWRWSRRCSVEMKMEIARQFGDRVVGGVVGARLRWRWRWVT